MLGTHEGSIRGEKKALDQTERLVGVEKKEPLLS